MADVSLRMTRFIFNPHATPGDTVLEIRGRAYGLNATLLNALRLNRQAYLILDDTALYFRSVGLGGLRDVIYSLDKVNGVQSGVFRPRLLWWGGLVLLALGVSLTVSLLAMQASLTFALLPIVFGLIAILLYLRSGHLMVAFTTQEDSAMNSLRFIVPKQEAHHVTRETLLQVIGYVNLVSLGGQVDRDDYITTMRLKPINVALEAEDEIVLRVAQRAVIPTAQAASADISEITEAVMDDLLMDSPTAYWTAQVIEQKDDTQDAVTVAMEEEAAVEPDLEILAVPPAIKTATVALEDEPATLEAPPMIVFEDAYFDDTSEAETIPSPAPMLAEIETVSARVGARSAMPTTAPFVETEPDEPVLRNPRDTAEQIAEAVSRGTGILPSLPDQDFSDSRPSDTRPVPSPAIKPVTNILRSAKDLFSDGRILYDEGEKLARSGLVDESQSKFRAAVALLTKAIEIDPNYYKSFGGRAKCYEALGDDEKAEQDWMLYRTLASTQGGTMSLRPPGM